MNNPTSKYAEAGVDAIKENYALEHMSKWIRKSFTLRKNDVGSIKLDLGYFANLIDIGSNIGLAVSTDGVGTKILIAQMMHKYDTIGIDCVAMNVNDVICLGANPIALLDYVAVQSPNANLLEEIAKGLYRGAEIAKISIPGGEISQMGEIVKGIRKDYGFDLVGTCIGIVSLDKAITGENINENDTIVGLGSDGIHSNGLTLAREVFFKKMKFKPDKYFNELNRTIGEELLQPTHIYVPEIMEMVKSGLNIKALINITGDGFMNLTRVASPVSYVIDYLPEPQPIFTLLQDYGNVTEEEMYWVYNMGIGFCIILPEDETGSAINIAKKHGVNAYRIGHVIKEKEKKVDIKPKRLLGKENRFYKY